MERSKAIIAAVMKQAPRSGNYFPGMGRQPYACVDDFNGDQLMSLMETEEDAVADLLDTVRRRYPRVTARVENEFARTERFERSEAMQAAE